MKVNIPKEWFIARANLEKGLEIGAGNPNFFRETFIKSLKIGDKILCKYSQGKFSGTITNIEYPHFKMEKIKYSGYPSVDVSGDFTVHETDVIEKL